MGQQRAFASPERPLQWITVRGGNQGYFYAEILGQAAPLASSEGGRLQISAAVAFHGTASHLAKSWRAGRAVRC